MPLAEAGYYCLAVDQRGYGRTTGWDARSFEDVDLSTFSVTELVRDMVILVHAVGYAEVHCVIGHDFGAVAASLCALMRPDLFRSVVLMSHPFKGSPKLQSASDVAEDEGRSAKPDIQKELANLPEPREHYKWYYSTPKANAEMARPEGIREFIRDYFYVKSADWPGNNPHPLKEWSASELAKMPYYYIMPQHVGMRQAVCESLHNEDPKVRNTRMSRWLSDTDLDFYVAEYSRTGFQGGLNWYRIQTDPSRMRSLDLFAGKKIEVPCLFIGGRLDWGIYQEPGVVEGMSKVCTDFQGTKIVDGAGHWIQQEKPEVVVEEVLAFLNGRGTSLD